VHGLEEAVEAARGRLDDTLVDDAGAVVERARARLRLSGDHTVVALAGATGSGKSSTFNAVAGLDLAAIGVRRPTTSWTMACAWGAEGAGDLLDWLGVPKRHQVSRDSMLDEPGADRDLQGLVLLDLPDHDSTEVSHHVEVDRLVQLADMIVWVLDPQKYADAAIHDRYLKRLATHRDIMIVVLNHIDEVPAERRPAMMEDLERLLKDDGLEGVPVVATAAPTGEGIDALKQLIVDRVAAKKATKARLLADVTVAGERMLAQSGTADVGDVARDHRQELVDAFADAAGVPTVVHAVESATRMRANRATGWPLTAWTSRLRPDPLRRLHLDVGTAGKQLTAGPRASVPKASQVQQARVDTAVRELADGVGGNLAAPWATAVRRASVSRLPDLNDALDRAVSRTDLGMSRTPFWWRLVRVLQWLLIIGAVGGGLWLAGLAVMSYLQLTAPETPRWQGFPLPTLMLLGGLAAGLLLAMSSRIFTSASARSRARTADRRLRAEISEVTDRLVIEPIEGEVDAYLRTRKGLETALR
jgi:GTP-binding protein EngB required for normal cell division